MSTARDTQEEAKIEALTGYPNLRCGNIRPVSQAVTRIIDLSKALAKLITDCDWQSSECCHYEKKLLERVCIFFLSTFQLNNNFRLSALNLVQSLPPNTMSTIN